MDLLAGGSLPPQRRPSSIRPTQRLRKPKFAGPFASKFGETEVKPKVDMNNTAEVFQPRLQRKAQLDSPETSD